MSVLFKTYHKEAVYQMLGKYEVGWLTDIELVKFDPVSQTAFYPTLKRVSAKCASASTTRFHSPSERMQRIEQHFKDTKQDPKNNVWIWLRYAAIVSTVLACSYAWLAYRDAGILLGVLISIVQGFACALVCSSSSCFGARARASFLMFEKWRSHAQCNNVARRVADWSDAAS